MNTLTRCASGPVPITYWSIAARCCPCTGRTRPPTSFAPARSNVAGCTGTPTYCSSSRTDFASVRSGGATSGAQTANEEALHFYGANNANFQYTGRVDFTNPELPRFWSPGVYIQARFKGTRCEIELNDEVLYGKSHNYITWLLTLTNLKELSLHQKKIKYRFANSGLESHTILICKGTEAGIGYLEFVGMIADTLLQSRCTTRSQNRIYRKLNHLWHRE